MRKLQGKVAVITGGTDGIGLAIAPPEGTRRGCDGDWQQCVPHPVHQAAQPLTLIVNWPAPLKNVSQPIATPDPDVARPPNLENTTYSMWRGHGLDRRR